MKNREPLMREVLEQGAPPEFQTLLMEKTLRAARRRKQVRQLGWSGLAVAVIFVVLLNSWHVSTVPLHSEMNSVTILHSRKLAPVMWVATHEPVQSVKSRKLTFAVVTTRKDSFHLLGDDELLGDLTGHPAVLVKRGSGVAELVFANPADMEGFPVAHHSRQ